MKKLFFSTIINAPKANVWDALWDRDSYGKWTAEFSEGSYAESEWQEGGYIRFLAPEGDGMYSIIERKDPPNYMSFKHIGVVKNWEDMPLDEESRKWTGAMENYTLQELGEGTELVVELDTTDDHESYFKEAFPRALNKVKELAETKVDSDGEVV